MSWVEIHTDGACRGNPGPGGWGAVLHYNGHEKLIWGGERETTNNRMELMAAIAGLKRLQRPCQVRLFTDSEYLRNGITKWLDGWKQRGWRTASRKPVKNKDLWQLLDEISGRHQIEWHWVRGHTGNPGNEKADALANRAIDEMLAGKTGS